jgi:sugar lactone lactonase YvrE
MKAKVIAALCTIAATLACRTGAQIYDTNGDYVQTFAGSGFYGYLDGQGTQTMFNGPSQVVADSLSNLFVLDIGNGRVRKITPSGLVSTFAGGGTQTTGYGTNVNVGYGGNYSSMAIDHSNTLWIPTFVGTLLQIGSNGYVSTTFLNGTSEPWGVCVDSGNNVYISDMSGNKIYRYTTNGILEVFAGSGNRGSADGNGVFTSFFSPEALASDEADNIYVWDSANFLIRKINQNRDVTTIAGAGGAYAYQNADGMGTNAAFGYIDSIAADNSGNLILACGNCVRKMTASTNVTTLAGSFTQAGYTNGPGSLARFNAASGVCVSGGTIYIADSANERIRSLTNNPTAQPVSPAALQLNTYPGLQITGTVGRTYQVQTSPDMTTWTTRATLVLNFSPYLWIDQSPVSGSKFYRALLLP